MITEEKKVPSIDLKTQKKLLKNALLEERKKTEVLEKDNEALKQRIKQFEDDITNIVIRTNLNRTQKILKTYKLWTASKIRTMN